MFVQRSSEIILCHKIRQLSDGYNYIVVIMGIVIILLASLFIVVELELFYHTDFIHGDTHNTFP